MNDHQVLNPPPALAAILRDTEAISFTMASEPLTGSLLRSLAASKPGGRALELGTGTGAGTAWLLEGLDAAARLDTVDSDADAVAIARRHLGHDGRVAFHVEDGARFLERARGSRFDLIFADTWPGKFTHLSEALALLGPGGLYVVDDLLPQPNWPADHAPKVPLLLAELERRPDLRVTKLSWSTGMAIAVKGS